ncbi:MAG: hypothetical protein Kow0042_28140 [Calditrichia bacterium]
MSPEAVKQTIQEIGVGKQIEILRIGFDGEIDDMPIIVEILDISESGFTGKIVNVERQMIESTTDKLVYAKKGGGIIEFFYTDGDIKEITVSKDAELLEAERDVEALREILSALEKGDHVIVAYYDSKQRGTLNAEGTIADKNDDGNTFTLKIERINRIELGRKEEKVFNIEKDLVIDIEIV